jgi:hypothetical protein
LRYFNFSIEFFLRFLKKCGSLLFVAIRTQAQFLELRHVTFMQGFDADYLVVLYVYEDGAVEVL